MILPHYSDPDFYIPKLVPLNSEFHLARPSKRTYLDLGETTRQRSVSLSHTTEGYEEVSAAHARWVDKGWRVEIFDTNTGKIFLRRDFPYFQEAEIMYNDWNNLN